MINIIFLVIFFMGLIYGCLTNRVSLIVEAILSTPKEAFYLFIDIYTLLVFWGGLLEICKLSGLLKQITYYLSYVLHPLFKNIKRDSEAMQYICLNLTANILSMGSAATPFGLRAMQELKKINNNEVASNEMITFLLINTSGLCLIPTMLISLRREYSSSNPVIIIPYILIVSAITTFFSIIIDGLVRKYGKH